MSIGVCEDCGQVFAGVQEFAKHECNGKKKK